MGLRWRSSAATGAGCWPPAGATPKQPIMGCSGGAKSSTPVVGGALVAAVDAENRVVISTREGAMKTLNLRRDPHATLCSFTDRFFGAWCTVEGTVEILSLPEALEPLVDYYRLTSGEHPDWEDYRLAMHREHRVLVRMTVERSGPTRTG